MTNNEENSRIKVDSRIMAIVVLITAITGLITAIGGLDGVINAILNHSVKDATPTPILTPTPTPIPTITPTLTITPTPTPTSVPNSLPSPTTTPTTPTVTPLSTSLPPPAMEFVLISAGEFDMGSNSTEVGSPNDERPVHHVKLAKAFYMSKYEVTQKQWREVMGDDPSYINGDDLPVENVSWNDVQQFIKKLNEKEGTTKYRLPSEAEWEYTARAGTTTRYSFGDDESKLDDYAWYGANSKDTTHPVGQWNPNAWGLYDMHGNVWEWVQDSYHSNYDGAPNDGSAWESGRIADRVARGGSWTDGSGDCRSAMRADRDPGRRNGYLGFRLVRDL